MEKQAFICDEVETYHLNILKFGFKKFEINTKGKDKVEK